MVEKSASLIEGAGHNDIWSVQTDHILSQIHEFLGES